MKVTTFSVEPNIPQPLQPLKELANNLWLSWNYDAVMLFMRLDYDLWMESHQNPAQLLGMVSQERYEELSGDDSFLAALNRVYERFQAYLAGDTWYTDGAEDVVAYFSMEYGLDVSLPIYSGGLGVLSGDHMKTSSDLGLPLIGVGLLYRQGYFQQYLNADGYQQESYPENDWYNMPVSVCRTDDDSPVKVTVQIGESVVVAQVWQVRIGRASLYLLDTNIPDNSEHLRQITASLYGGTKETRIQQEILLGIGGIRALRALGINATVAHMNEGHSAFLAIERIRELIVNEKLTFDQAVEAIRPTSIFTTHTPVPAGNERFAPELMHKYFHSIVDGIPISYHDFMALGRENPHDELEHFCMTILAVRLSAYNNAVSELHGAVSRDMWKQIWPGLPVHEVPIKSITNGVHPRTWLNHDLQDVLDRYFGPRFYDDPTYLEIWNRMDRVSDEELWRTHERRKERLVTFVRERLRSQLKRRGLSGTQLGTANQVLSPYSFTISFARRFATYKRATLLFRDRDRLYKLLTNTERPVQVIFSGKAHPHDVPGKNLIKDIVHFAQQPELRSRIVFVENYDMGIAKYLVSGADLWMNTPRRPMEASGTSGMKAAINGVLNCSILDGWWAEGYTPDVGWAIGSGEYYEDEEEQDEVESKLLYDLLEREILPLYFDRGRDGLPHEWIRMMKASMAELAPRFSSHRMLMEYADHFYRPALANAARVRAGAYKAAKSLAEHMARLRKAWPSIQVVTEPALPDRRLNVGDDVELQTRIHLGDLKPDDVTVELYHGPMSTLDEIAAPTRTPMTAKGAGDNGTYAFTAVIRCTTAGRQGLSVRVLPRHPQLVDEFVPGFVVAG
ncbi:MAG: glycosyltransferase family 1 protein [Spirochaetaceae bacterium]|nr:MAG: glycosyltransferase family 1 protein [Spirochaetaceae bacterium]